MAIKKLIIPEGRYCDSNQMSTKKYWKCIFLHNRYYGHPSCDLFGITLLMEDSKKMKKACKCSDCCLKFYHGAELVEKRRQE